MKLFIDQLQMSEFPIRACEAFAKMPNASPEYTKAYQVSNAKIGMGSVLGFLGERGTGKTVMSVAVASAVLNKGRSVLYTTAHRLFMRYKATYRKDSDESELDVHEAFQKPSLLVIDEVGRRQESDWENRMLIDLGDARYGAKKDTIFISNQTQEIFDESIGDSLVSRMNECGGCIHFDWPTFRSVQ